MRRFLIACFFGVSSLGLFSCGVHDFLDFKPLTEAKMVEALQEALVFGSKTAANNLGDSSCSLAASSAGECLTGYLGNKLVEIALPDTVKDVLDKVSSFTSSINGLPTPAKTLLAAALGVDYNSIFNLGRYGDSIKVALNRGAEQAAPMSIEVFRNAIFGMSFSDAKGVLKGDSMAATSYLNTMTYSGLQVAFAPIIKEPLDLLNPNGFWNPLARNYNSFAKTYSSISVGLSTNTLLKTALDSSSLPDLPYSALPEDISKILSEYATGKALDGLFFMVGKQETKLRADPWGTVKGAGGFITDAVGDLLGDVFDRAKEGLL
ncbi:MAG: DUF4197 domain-containing protein [Fibromonadaceae bacterium]|jgi:hypothetical protein|nr:DUF4197 domain-containing protein [Fibromonadaceae bacterium]